VSTDGATKTFQKFPLGKNDEGITLPVMRRPVHRSRSQIQRTPVRLLRRVEPARTIVRSKRIHARRDVAHPTDLPAAAFGGVQPNAYVDYERVLTAEGGIRITYALASHHLAGFCLERRDRF